MYEVLDEELVTNPRNPDPNPDLMEHMTVILHLIT